MTLPSTFAELVDLRPNEHDRGIYARKWIRRGDRIVIEKPHAWCVRLADLNDFCSNCMEALKKKKHQCKSCMVLKYCSAACQSAHLPIHRLECTALCVFFKLQPQLADLDSIILLARMLLAQSVIRMQSDKPLEPALAAVADSFPLAERMGVDNSLPDYAMICVQLVQAYIGLANNDLTDNLLSEDVISKWRVRQLCNSLNLDDEGYSGNTKPGIAIYPSLSLFNHSCNPNCHWSNVGLDASVRAVRDIAPDEELTISYAPLMFPSYTRREVLARYGIDCKCDRCTDSLNSPDGLSLRDRQMLGYRCVDRCHGLPAYTATDVPKIVICPECSHEWNGQDLHKRLQDAETVLEMCKKSVTHTTMILDHLLTTIDVRLAPHHLINVRIYPLLQDYDGQESTRVLFRRRMLDHALYFGDESMALKLEWARIFENLIAYL